MNTQENQTKEKMGQLLDDTHSLLAATAHDTDEAVVEARNRLQSALDAASETCDRVKARAVQGAKAADKVIRESPYQTAAIALGVGVLLGFLLSRRSRD
jgi:ElaB/YqjD/DUF883 family membrane-anchored ribosome-binding protein